MVLILALNFDIVRNMAAIFLDQRDALPHWLQGAEKNRAKMNLRERVPGEMIEHTELLHALSQPVNVIRLTVANIGTRLLSRLEGDDKAYLSDRLAVIEAQIERFVVISEQDD